LASRGERANELAIAALAVATGELLPTDPYATWAIDLREPYRRRRLAMLDLLAAKAVENGRLEEACLLLDEAIGVDPYGAARYHLAADYLTQLGRREAARHLIDSAAARLAQLGVTKDRRTMTR
jgi:DNA-binding SARP family transcriptional activator